MGAFDRWHNYSRQGILDNLKTFKRAGRKIIVERITVIKFRRYKNIGMSDSRRV